jgi:ceramide synthetase
LIAYFKFNSKSDREKFPESLWKTVAYTCLWSYTAHILVFSGRYDYFTKPENIWDGKSDRKRSFFIIVYYHSFFVFLDWELGMKIPAEITNLYFIECGFYLHSVYATIYMDAKRKDYFVMLLHHALTLVLIIASYATR